MSKLIAFVGSTRKNGNIDTVVKEVIRGATENQIETKIYYLNDMTIKPCQACMYCRQPEHEHCVIKDDLRAIYAEIKDADYLILSSPVYIHQMSGLLKNLLDRFYPLTNEKHKPRFGIKKTIFIYSQAAPIPLIFDRYFRYTEKSLKAMGIKPIKRITVLGAFTKDAIHKKKRLLNKAYNIGKNLINN